MPEARSATPLLLHRRAAIQGAAAALALGGGQARATAPAWLGVYGGNDPASIRQFEAWLGCPVTQCLVFTEQENWSGIAQPQWFIERFAELHKPAIWSVAMIPRHGTLESAARGAQNHHFRRAAQALARAQPHPDGAIYIRTGWEFNADWFPWAAAGQQPAFIATYRNLVESFRAVSPRFRFEWNMNYGQQMDPESAFPGAAYVDVIGMDFYWAEQYLGRDPRQAFERIRDGRYGLRYLDRLAQTHGKPVALSEWGVQGNQAAPFIGLVQEWIAARNVLYHNYWDSDADYPGRLSAGRWPETGAAFRAAFCQR